MVNAKRLLDLSKMEQIAKDATFIALAKYVPPSEEEKRHLTLSKIVTETEGIFELYIPGERPQDAKVISCAKVSRLNGDVSVEVFLEPV